MSNKVSTYLAFVIALFAAYLFRYYLDSSWHFQRALDHDDFTNEQPFTIKEVPTTYYKKGHIEDVLPQWHQESGPYIHLYRLAEGEKFDFDLEQVKDIKVHARELAFENCTRPESSLCMGCEASKQARHITMGDIFNRKYGAHWFSSFTKLEVADQKEIKKAEDTLTVSSTVASSLVTDNIYDKMFPSFANNKVYDRLHTFVSNFDYDRVSTQIHCNSFATSAAVQLVGSKSWLIYPIEIYLGKDYLESKPARLTHFPTHSPKKPYYFFQYTSRPGDILFFTESYGHSVFSHQGPNYMVNYRKLPELANLMYNPLAWLHSFGFFLFSAGLETAAKPDIVNKAMALIAGTCEGRLSDWDQQMVDLLKSQKSGANYYK